MCRFQSSHRGNLDRENERKRTDFRIAGGPRGSAFRTLASKNGENRELGVDEVDIPCHDPDASHVTKCVY